jgi:hypothetical protein
MPIKQGFFFTTTTTAAAVLFLMIIPNVIGECQDKECSALCGSIDANFKSDLCRE